MKILRTPQNKQLMKQLNAARRRTGLTQQELAEKIGARPSFVAKYERGERKNTLSSPVRSGREG